LIIRSSIYSLRLARINADESIFKDIQNPTCQHMVLSLLMKQRQLTNFRQNTFVWLMLSNFSIIGLILLFGRFLFWEEVLQIIEFFFSPDRHLENNGVAIVEQLVLPFTVLHIGLGVTGWIFLFSKPWLASKGIIIIDQKIQTRNGKTAVSIN
jgi:hypothetical protein